MARISFIFSTISATAAFYLLIGFGVIQNELVSRYFAGHPVEYIETALFFVGVMALLLKAGDLAFEVLSDEPGIRPAPYLASRGMKWLQVYEPRGMSDASLREHIVTSYDLVVVKLTKKTRAELGV